MSGFAYTLDDATRDAGVSTEPHGTYGMGSFLPMAHAVRGDFEHLPWEATPSFLPACTEGVFPPFSHVTIQVRHERGAETAAKYIARMGHRFPKDKRDGFVSGAGMFSFESTAADVLDDLMG